MAVIKRIKTRRCTACKRVILIGESFETRSIGKARFYYCYSCAFWGKEPAEESGLTKREPDKKDSTPPIYVFSVRDLSTKKGLS